MSLYKYLQLLAKSALMKIMSFVSLFTHGSPKSSLGTRSKVSMRFRSNWNLKMLVFVEGGKPEYPEKNPRSRDENQQQTQPIYVVESRNRTRATLVGGETSALTTALSPFSCPFQFYSTSQPNTTSATGLYLTIICRRLSGKNHFCKPIKAGGTRAVKGSESEEQFTFSAK